ncbi:MAG: hypothetical protein GXP38_00135 [Chloroflexi bacterium]|nr:hypothetical protein [Chloroflexota bacterium]
MTESWLLLIWIILLLFALYWASRKLAQYFIGTFYLLSRSENAATAIYVLSVLPGTLIHETSHWLMAQLVGVRTGDISIMPRFQRKGPIRLGSVNVKGGNLIQLTLVGIAPFLVGLSLTVWLSYSLFDVTLLRAVWHDFSLLNLGRVVQDVLARRDSMLGLYLLFTVSDAMFLSPSDRAPLTQLLVYSGIIAAILLALSGPPSLSPAWTETILGGVQLLATGLAIALGVHVTLLVIFALTFFLLQPLLR